jgi:hypothetical protein
VFLIISVNTTPKATQIATIIAQINNLLMVSCFILLNKRKIKPFKNKLPKIG